MADSYSTYMPELDDVHRWLPSNVLRDIGITDSAERRHLAVVDDLAARLVSVLGGGAPHVEMAAAQHPPSSRHHPVQVIRGHHALASTHRPRVAAAAQPYQQALAVPWQAMTTNTMVLHPAAALQMAPAANQTHPLFCGSGAGASQQSATTRRSSGTGFFLPQTAKVATAVPPRHKNHVAMQRQCRAWRHRQRDYEAGAAMARRQQELIAQTIATTMVQTRQLAGAPATSCPELALPREWAY
uniref:Uncharacterized protein n=1 Tax=Leersia perrieri TaxID=77586 RepID=A0A0D9VU30_9ORYZ